MARKWISPIGITAEEASARRSARDPEYRRLRDQWQPYEEVAWQLIRYRMDHKLTQQQLARKVGTSHSQISRIESGRHRTSVETLRRIAEALGMRLIIGLEPMTRNRPRHRAAV
jgi:DNA-binding XRE family transcriptional regulator